VLAFQLDGAGVYGFVTYLVEPAIKGKFQCRCDGQLNSCFTKARSSVGQAPKEGSRFRLRAVSRLNAVYGQEKTETGRRRIGLNESAGRVFGEIVYPGRAEGELRQIRNALTVVRNLPRLGPILAESEGNVGGLIMASHRRTKLASNKNPRDLCTGSSPNAACGYGGIVVLGVCSRVVLR